MKIRYKLRQWAGRIAVSMINYAGEDLEEVLSVREAGKEAQIMLQLHYRQMVHQGFRPLPTFAEVGFRRYSQFEEDGILLYIFSLIPPKTRICLEMCAGDGRQCNTANLIINHGWQGFLFDGDHENVRRGERFFGKHKDTFLWPPRFTHAWITADNVNQLIQEAGAMGEIDLLSLDIDGMDYWIWNAIEVISPRVVVCEIQNPIPAAQALTVPYNAAFVASGDDYRGASLAAMSKLAQQKGFRLVGAHRHGFNAFFVKKGLGAELLPEVSPEQCLQDPYTKFAQQVRWPKVKDRAWVKV